MTTKQKVGLIGALLLLVGVFLPFMNTPSGETVSYWGRGGGVGGALVLLALASAFLAFVNKHILLWYTGLVALAIVTYSFVEYQFAREDSLAAAKERAEAALMGTLDALAGAAPDLVELRWGFGVLVAGVLLVMLGAILGERAPAA